MSLHFSLVFFCFCSVGNSSLKLSSEAETYGSCVMDFDGQSEAVSKIIDGSHEMCKMTERLDLFRSFRESLGPLL